VVGGFEVCERFILDRMRESRIPGLAVCVVEGDRVSYLRGFGFRDLDSGLPVNPGTLFGIGSVTKSFTALAVLQLVEKGRVDLDDSVDEYVDLGVKPFGEDITVHHLLTHSSGIPALAYAEAFIRGVLELDVSWLPVSSARDVITFMKGAGDWAYCKPGEKFFYLNEGYVILGEIIARATGLRYEDYVKKSILLPLKMERSYFFREEVERDGDFATPYIIDREGRHVKSKFPYGITADGGLISNVVDLANYIRMYLNRGVFEGFEVIDRDMIELMEKEHVRRFDGVFGPEYYGYGWGIIPNFHGYKLVHHSGSVLVHTAYVGYIPEKKIGVAILANASGYPLSNIGMYILTHLLGYDPEKLPFIEKDRILNKLTGTYETYKSTMKIEVKKRGCILEAVSRDKLTEFTWTLIPDEISKDKCTFYMISNWRKMPVEFTIKDGRVELILERYKLIKKT